MYRRNTRDNSSVAPSSSNSSMSNIATYAGSAAFVGSNTSTGSITNPVTMVDGVSNTSIAGLSHKGGNPHLLSLPEDFQAINTINNPISAWSADYLPYSFVLISFGYMLPWTALGSLLSYFKFTYSAQFYVQLYCAYYLPGLPVAILQYWWGEWLDTRFGSQFMFTLRGCVVFAGLLLIQCFLMGTQDETCMLGLFAGLGVMSWYLHGTASMLAAMFPKQVVVYLQIGFRTPELYAVLMNVILNLGKDAKASSLITLLQLNCVGLLLGGLCWLWVTSHRVTGAYFLDKDQRNQHQLLVESKLKAEDDEEQQTLIPSVEMQCEVDQSGCMLAEESLALLPLSRPPSSRPGTTSRIIPASIPALCDCFNNNNHNKGSTSSNNSNSVNMGEMEEQAMLYPLCLTLMLTMWNSIFTAAFFAYVNSPQGRDIEQHLYFMRLFGDLLGRPLTFWLRPRIVQTPQGLLTIAILRVLCSSVFFMYTFLPGFPQNDGFIMLFVGFFSMASGYLSVLTYEFVAKEHISRVQRARSTNILNMAFQLAAFVAVIMSVIATRDKHAI